MRFAPRDPKEYLYSKIKRDDATGCWNWTGHTFSGGYGFFKCKAIQRNPMNASRGSWVVHNGDPGPLMVLHKCDNRLCVNPDHLFLGTSKDNMGDCKDKGRTNRGEARPQAKLTHQTAFEIRWLNAMGWSYGKLAEMFGVSRSACFSVVTGQTWRPDPCD